MKIIYVANVRLPTQKAHGIQIIKTCEAVALAGVDLELIIPSNNNHNIHSNIFDYYGVKKNFSIKKINLPNFIFLGRFGFYVNFLLFNFFVSFLLIYRKIIGKSDAFIYTRGEPIIILGPMVGRIYQIFWESHEKPKHKLIPIYKFALKKIRGIVTVTKYYKKEIFEELKFSKNILCAPDGVDFEKFNLNINKKEAREKVLLPQEKKIVLYCGSFFRYPYKGVDVILETAKLFNEECLFVLLGGTEEEIKKIKLDESPLLLLTATEYKMMPHYLASADLLLLPNKKGDPVSEFYTSPMKLFEYMASGVPIVASNICSLREVLEENSAFIFEPNNPSDMARVIKFAIGNEIESKKRADNAKELSKEYAWNKRAEKIIGFIKELSK